jgi:anti-anti-sigma factor
MEDGKILYAMVEKTCILKLVGAIVYKISPCFDRFLMKVSEDSSIEKFIVDLTETCHIDSTNLGLLARLHEYSSAKSGQPPTVVSTNENINEVLKNIGFAKMFNLIESLEECESDLKELPMEDCDKKNLSEIMLNAHRELDKLNEANKELFKDVIKYLEEETLNNLSFSR